MEDNPIINIISCKISSEIVRNIIKEIIDNALYLITELEIGKNEAEEVILMKEDSHSNTDNDLYHPLIDDEEIDELQIIVPNSNNLENNSDLNKHNNNHINFSNNENINKFLSDCKNKIKKGIRLTIENKMKINLLNKSNPILYSRHQIANILIIQISTVSKWIKKDNLFQVTEKQSKSNLPGQGRKSIFYPYERELISYLYELRKEKLAINSYILIEKI